MIGLGSDPKQQPLKSKPLARVCGTWDPKIVCYSNCARVQCSEITDVFCQSCICKSSAVCICAVKTSTTIILVRTPEVLFLKTSPQVVHSAHSELVLMLSVKTGARDGRIPKPSRPPTLTWGLRLRFKPRKT